MASRIFFEKKKLCEFRRLQIEKDVVFCYTIKK